MFHCLIKETYNSTRHQVSNEFDNDKEILWTFVDVIVSVACIISVLGNLLVVAVYHTMKTIRIQSRRILIINLALADTGMALTMFIIATEYSFQAVTVDVMEVPSTLVVVIVVYTVGHFASFFLLFLIAVDTWKSYYDPLAYNRSTMVEEDVRVMCVIIWIFSACLSSTFFVSYTAVCVLLIYNTFLFLMSITFSCIQLSIVCASQIRRREQKKQRKAKGVNSWPVMRFRRVPFVFSIISSLTLASLIFETVTILLAISSFNVLIVVIAIFMKCFVVLANPLIYWFNLKKFRDRFTEIVNGIKEHMRPTINRIPCF